MPKSPDLRAFWPACLGFHSRKYTSVYIHRQAVLIQFANRRNLPVFHIAKLFKMSISAFDFSLFTLAVTNVPPARLSRQECQGFLKIS